MNQPDQALKWRQITADDGFPCYPLFVQDAQLDNLRKNPRFMALLATLKEQWERNNKQFGPAKGKHGGS